MIKNLTELKPLESGVVIEIQGGSALAKRLEVMGVRLGKKVIKINAQFWRGPQVVKIDNSKVAIGYGMARKILLEVSR